MNFRLMLIFLFTCEDSLVNLPARPGKNEIIASCQGDDEEDKIWDYKLTSSTQASKHTLLSYLYNYFRLLLQLSFLSSNVITSAIDPRISNWFILSLFNNHGQYVCVKVNISFHSDPRSFCCQRYGFYLHRYDERSRDYQS